ncbi:hypothetical protein ACIRSS_50165 [Amycolatopsis sp. NPDC101161]|uniref:hypothetical protein n=1 Tax=Amycolatopsis sp. NPDC101161 TaxID=3363940 RepID=UPI0037FE6211
MNGPQHFREAERIAQILLAGKDKGRRLTVDDIARYAAAGELHARLAQVAATIRPERATDTSNTGMAWLRTLQGEAARKEGTR